MRVNGTMFSKVFIPALVTLFTCGISWVGSTPDSGSGVWSDPGNASGVGGRRRSSAPGNDSWVKRGLLLPLSPPPVGPQRRDILSTTLQQTEALTDAHTLPGALPRSTIDESPEPGESAASPGSAEVRRASTKAENREKVGESSADGKSPEEKSSLGPLSSGPPAQLAGALRSNTAELSLRAASVSDLPLEAFNDSIVYPVTSPTPPSVATEATSDDRVFFPDAWSTPSSAESPATPGDTQAFSSKATSATPPSAVTIVFPPGTTPLSATTPPPSTPPPAIPSVTTDDPKGTTSGEVDVNDKVSIIVPPRPCPGLCEVRNGGVCAVDLLCQERQTNSP